MNPQPESESEIQEELEELGVDNEATGSPDLFVSGPLLSAIAAVLIILLVAGSLYLVF